MKSILPTFILLLLASFIFGCQMAQVHPTFNSAGKETKYKAVAEHKVLIYRSTLPRWKYNEIGIITLKGGALRAPHFYKALRQRAAKSGAHAVIELKIKHGVHPVTTSSQSCTTSANGAQSCQTTTQTTMQPHFTATGSIVRRKK